MFLISSVSEGTSGFLLCCQVDTWIPGPGSQSQLQTSSQDVTIHSSQQHPAEPRGHPLCVGKHLQLKPHLGELLAAAPGGAEQLGGKPHGAVEHHQWIQWNRHERFYISRKHIATRLWFSLTKCTQRRPLSVPRPYILYADWILWILPTGRWGCHCQSPPAEPHCHRPYDDTEMYLWCAKIDAMSKMVT